jgi:hypothetical protein
MLPSMMYCFPERAGGLQHLVMSAAPPVDEFVTEIDCGVIDDLRLLVGKQIPIASMRRYKPFTHVLYVPSASLAPSIALTNSTFSSSFSREGQFRLVP